MDGEGRCQQSRQTEGDSNCTCAFCTEDRPFCKSSDPINFSRGSNGSVAATSGTGRVDGIVGFAQLPQATGVKEGAVVAGRATSAEEPLTSRSGQSTRQSGQQCRSLVSLCVGYLGRHLEEIIEDIHVIAPAFPAPIKGKLLAIARRRGLLCDELLIALADDSWEILDVSGSDVTDTGLVTVANMSPQLQAVDISRCSQLTPRSVRALVQHCPSLTTLRCGGISMSNAAARGSVSYFLPRLDHNEETKESWEDLDTKPVGKGAQALLRWLVWPSIDSKSAELLEIECPRIVINPTPSWKAFLHLSVPREAQPGIVLDDLLIEDIDPRTWAVTASLRPRKPAGIDEEKLGLSVAERFRLAFSSRDERLAPKRAKNMRQNQRRAEKAWLSSDTQAKAQVWAAIAHKSLRNWAQ